MASRKHNTRNLECFVLTLPLRCEPWQRDRLDTLFHVANDMKNNLIAYERKQLAILTSQKAYRKIQKQLFHACMMREVNQDVAQELIREFGVQRVLLLESSGFSESAFQKQINKYRQHYKRKNSTICLINIHIAQKIASSVWMAFHSFFYKKGKKIHFSKLSEFTTISAKNTISGIIYRGNGIIEINKMVMQAILDKKDRYGYQQEALKRSVRFCSISRKWYANGWKYFLQLTLDGKPPMKIDPNTGELIHALGSGRVGHDIGTQTLASCGESNVQLAELADRVKPIDNQLRCINRAMDRSRRATNPQMFDATGCAIPIDKLPKSCLTERNTRRWYKSKRYLQLEGIRRELYRRQAELRAQQHHELANQLLAFGDVHFIEEMRFRALAKKSKEDKVNAKGKHHNKKRLGKSISNKAPAAFVTILKQKVENAGGAFIKVDTIHMKASQFNHLTETYTKKNLSQRWAIMPDGKRIQRDLYSAFLIMNVNDTYDAVDVQRCNNTYLKFIQLHDAEIERLKTIFMPNNAGSQRAV